MGILLMVIAVIIAGLKYFGVIVAILGLNAYMFAAIVFVIGAIVCWLCSGDNESAPVG